MKLTLSTAEQRLLVRLSRALQSTLPDDWLTARPEVATDLQRLFRADFLGTTRWNSREHCFDQAMCVGRDDQMATDYENEFQFCDPISKKLQSRNAPTLVRGVIDPADFNQSRYFNEFLRPYDTLDGLDMHVAVGGCEIGDLRIWRGTKAPDFEERDVAMLQLLEPAISGAFRRRRRLTADLIREWFPVLTGREAEVAAVVTSGHSDRRAASTLGCSEWTIRTHLSNVFAKLGVANRTELTAAVHKRGYDSA